MSGRPTWAGRIAGRLDADADEFLNREWDEHRIADEDVVATAAHVRTLEAAGLLKRTEARKLLDALERLGPPDGGYEDVHSMVEHMLTDRFGEAGARLHAGRSRNDLVATDLRLWARKALVQLLDAVLGLTEALTERAEETIDVVVPGYTHLQRAQPITLGYWHAAHASAFARDAARVVDAYEACDVCPLGAGALAGNTLGLDPRIPAKLLGFSHTFGNAMDITSDRSFLVDAVHAWAHAATHLSRIGEEIVLWSSSEYGFVILPDSHSTGSSMMPQKRNPDVAELARAEAGAAAGVLTDLLVTLKGLPLAYDRDLQATKRSLGPLARAPVALRAFAGLMRSVTYDRDRLLAAASDDRLLATDLAEALVARGVAFRTAHERVGALALLAESSGSTLAGAVGARPDALEPLTLRDALTLLDPVASIRRRATPGGPSPRSVRTQIRKLRRDLARLRSRHTALSVSLPTVKSVRSRAL